MDLLQDMLMIHTIKLGVDLHTIMNMITQTTILQVTTTILRMDLTFTTIQPTILIQVITPANEGLIEVITLLCPQKQKTLEIIDRLLSCYEKLLSI
jgi:hypothetical protein